MPRRLLAAFVALTVLVPQTASANEGFDSLFDRSGTASPWGKGTARVTPFWESSPAQPAPAARPRPVAKGAKRLEGGGRPAITPQAPPVVAFGGGYGTGSVVIDTRTRALYYVLGGGRAYRYAIAVGKEGFSWTGTESVSRVAAWPDWRPPAEMRQRDPRLPELMTGGLNNPLGAKAIYLGSTLYRIHGTNNPRSIGSASSSGCFRMTNANVEHLASLVGVGTKVHVLRRLPANVAGSAAPVTPRT